MRVANSHFKTIIGKIWKLIPLFEKKNQGLTDYIDSLIFELEGLCELMDSKRQSMLTSVISILKRIHKESKQPNPNFKVVRREVFGCLDIVEKMMKYSDENE